MLNNSCSNSGAEHQHKTRKRKKKRKKTTYPKVKLILLINHRRKLLHFAERKPKLYVPGQNEGGCMLKC